MNNSDEELKKAIRVVQIIASEKGGEKPFGIFSKPTLDYFRIAKDLLKTYGELKVVGKESAQFDAKIIIQAEEKNNRIDGTVTFEKEENSWSSKFTIDLSTKSKEQLHTFEFEAIVLEILSFIKGSDILFAVLKEKDLNRKKAAVKAIGNLSDPKFITALVEILQNSPSDLKKLIIETLGKMKDPKVVSPIALSLRDVDPVVRASAKVALFNALRSGLPIDETVLFLLEDKDAGIRSAIVDILANVSNEKIVEALLKALNDENPNIRLRSVQALEKIKDQRAIGPLSKLLMDKDVGIRLAVVQAIGSIGHEKAVEYLSMALKDSEWRVRKALAKALGNTNDPSATPYLVELLRDE